MFLFHRCSGCTVTTCKHKSIVLLLLTSCLYLLTFICHRRYLASTLGLHLLMDLQPVRMLVSWKVGCKHVSLPIFKEWKRKFIILGDSWYHFSIQIYSVHLWTGLMAMLANRGTSYSPKVQKLYEKGKMLWVAEWRKMRLVRKYCR